jgi:hypothetical protein
MTELAWSGDISSWVRELLSVSQRAWDLAASRDFVGLAGAIGERDRLIKGFKAFDTRAMSPNVRKEVAGVLEAARKIDVEIKKALEHEMEQDSRAIRDTANKARALTAYDRVLSRPRRFDRTK